MKMCMMAIGKTIKLMVTVHILIKMALLIKEIGKIIFKTDMELKNGLKTLFMKDISKLVKKMDKVCINGLMGLLIQGNGKIIIYLV